MENSKSIREQKQEVNKDITDLQKQMETVNNELQDIQVVLDQLEDVEDQYNNLQDAKSKEDKIDREINQLLQQTSYTDQKKSELGSSIKETQKLIEDWHTNEEQIKKNTEVRKQIDVVQVDLDSVKEQVRKTNKQLLDLNGEVSTLQSNKQQIQERIEEVKELEEQNKLYDYYLNALGKDGIPYELIEKALPMIEGEVNNILGQIVEFGMQLEMDGKNIDAYLVYGDQRWSLEMCSGMERFISGLAIRVALINVCNLPRPNFLVIDEGFGTLDSENLQSLFMLFSYLKTQFDFVMVISHIDSMRDVVDDLVEIKKVDGRSHVKF
jgi:DNA repair exonuclease SbcCD ATPase subunit